MKLYRSIEFIGGYASESRDRTNLRVAVSNARLLANLLLSLVVVSEPRFDTPLSANRSGISPLSVST